MADTETIRATAVKSEWPNAGKPPNRGTVLAGEGADDWLKEEIGRLAGVMLSSLREPGYEDRASTEIANSLKVWSAMRRLINEAGK